MHPARTAAVYKMVKIIMSLDSPDVNNIAATIEIKKPKRKTNNAIFIAFNKSIPPFDV